MAPAQHVEKARPRPAKKKSPRRKWSDTSLLSIRPGVRPEDLKQFREWLGDAAGGNCYGLFQIGRRYDEREDYVEAMRWYRAAADMGSVFALNRMAWLYHGGNGVAQNRAEAMRLFRKSAAAGWTDSMYAIGLHFKNGEGVTQDYVEAMRWFQMAVDKGCTDSMQAIGLMHERGLGVPRDDAEAMRWFGKGLRKGNTYSTYWIGLRYKWGDGVPRDIPKAIRLLRKANDGGHRWAGYTLGRMYYDGHGVERNRNTALRYFRDYRGDYAAIRTWLALAWLGRGSEANRGLQEYRANHASPDWETSIMDFLAGDFSDQELLDEAGPDPKKLCGAYFYVGSLRLMAGNRAAAISYFRKCIGTGVDNYTEYESAEAELRRLPR